MFPSEWNLNAWLIISSLEGVEGVFVLIVRPSLIPPKLNWTGKVFASVNLFFLVELSLLMISS